MSRRRRVGLLIKRAMDLTGAIIGIVLFAPLLAWAAVGLAVTQGFPILFRQQRPGLHAQPFRLVKFRTMRSPRRGEIWYDSDAERVTRVGRLLRATSIDELPELWNVLRGEMSLVGPRPLLVEYLEHYTEEERRRHDMRPGITGWAAVNGRHTARFEDRLKLDIWYVDHWSLTLDLRILLMTIAQVVRRESVSVSQDLAVLPARFQTGLREAHHGDDQDRGPAG